MTASRFETRPIRLMFNGGNSTAGNSDAYASLRRAFDELALELGNAANVRHDDRGLAGWLAIIGEFLTLMATLDTAYGPQAELPLKDADSAGNDALRALAELESALTRLDLAHRRPQIFAMVVGVGYWMMCHRLAIDTPAPIVNALAEQANAAQSTQETAAVYALMQGFIQHLQPQLSADLERSNPERPWRLLNLNFAITAIRSGDPELIRYAFDTLNNHLPLDCGGFYQEAFALAAQPGFSAATRDLIEAQWRRWAPAH